MKPLKGSLGFQSFYRSIYGDRWTSIEEALLKPARQVVLWNPLQGEAPKSLIKVNFDMPVEVYEGDLESSSLRENNNYLLDLASVLAVCALPKSNSWLDLCAAPGGKTLVRIYSHQGEIKTIANELSAARMKRLRSVLKSHLPQNWYEAIYFTQRDASRLRINEPVEAVLVDAPCSGERHLLSDAKELEHWSEKRSRGLAIRQHAILCNALELVEEGGHILYSTCSLSPLENDEVIKKFLKKRAGRVILKSAPIWLGESTEMGVQIVPDKAVYGPIYYSLLQKVPTEK